MSAAVREALADAISSVDGLSGHAYFIAATEPGHGLVRLDRIEFPNRFGGIAYWSIVLILPQDSAGAEVYLETFLPGLLDALKPELVIDSVEPQRLDIPSVGVLPVATITGHRETD